MLYPSSMKLVKTSLRHLLVLNLLCLSTAFTACLTVIWRGTNSGLSMDDQECDPASCSETHQYDVHQTIVYSVINRL